jgi:hypothetical protein
MQTCSGKTYTLQGTNESPGVTSRSLSYLFKSATSDSASYDSFAVALSMLEIYNDAVFDLLTASSEDSQPAFGTSLRRKSLASGTCSTPGSRRSSLVSDSVTPRRKSIGRTEGRAESAARLDFRSDHSGARVVGVLLMMPRPHVAGAHMPGRASPDSMKCALFNRMSQTVSSVKMSICAHAQKIHSLLCCGFFTCTYFNQSGPSHCAYCNPTRTLVDLGAQERQVWSQGTALEVLSEGYGRRQSAAMASNRCSSRSHCLVCITLSASMQVRLHHWCISRTSQPASCMLPELIACSSVRSMLFGLQCVIFLQVCQEDLPQVIICM